MESFNLHNTRFDPASDTPGPKNNRIYDSTEDTRVRSSLTPATFTTISLNSTQQRLPDVPPKYCGNQSFDSTDVDRIGNIYEMSKSAERASNRLLFSATSFEEYNKPHENTAPRDPPIAEHDRFIWIETVKQRLEKGLPGALWSSGGHIGMATISPSLTHHYDVDRYYAKFRDHHINSKQQKFATTDCGRANDSDFVPPIHPSMSRATRKLAAIREKEGEETFVVDEEPEIKSSLSGPAVKFSTLPRYKHPIYFQEGYIKTTGLTLSPTFDENFDKRIPFSMASAAARKTCFEFDDPLESYVDAKCVQKPTVALTVKFHPRRYAAAFKSKAPSGYHVPLPVTSEDLGPGAYDGTTQSTLRVYAPDKASPAFLPGSRSSGIFDKTASPDILADLRPCQEPHGGQFDQAGQQAGRNIHLAKIAKAKISKVYPKFARRKYGPPVVTLDAMMESCSVADSALTPYNTSAASHALAQLMPRGASGGGARPSL